MTRSQGRHRRATVPSSKRVRPKSRSSNSGGASGAAPPPASDTILAAYHTDWPAWSAADAVSGMTFTRITVVTIFGGARSSQASTADADDGDYMEFLFDVDAGTYKLTCMHGKEATSPIVDFVIDGTTVGSADFFKSGGYVGNFVAEVTGIALSAGVHTLRLLANGKNASSSDFFMGPQTLSLTRTGA